MSKQLHEQAVLVGIVKQDQTKEQLFEYLDELDFLALTAGAVTQKKFYQNISKADPKTYIGKGKLDEIKQYVKAKEIDIVIFDDSITPAQQRNLEKELKVKVVDRTMLILDIFSQRAQTVQARTQVELAQTQYLLPRLRGMWTHLDRVKGGIGMRGAGEKEIETDRRIASKKIAKLKEQLAKIDQQGQTRRKSRSGMIRVALVGYTNVGKSTIMRVLSKEKVFAENKLFATLDTTVRKVVISNVPFLLSDTVGFIRKLPHQLVESFKSTLDEALEADVLLHVVDISHPNFEEQMEVVMTTLQELKFNEKTIITVFNKMDLFEKQFFDEYMEDEDKWNLLEEMKKSWLSKLDDRAIFISAIKNENVDELRDAIFEKVKELYLQRYPYKAGYI